MRGRPGKGPAERDPGGPARVGGGAQCPGVVVGNLSPDRVRLSISRCQWRLRELERSGVIRA
ncbi:winged helix-turn-helix domain-containing protein [Streptomyces sp. LN549]|uniref:winged helix-turn-helix domain-containing protein n=1 Tax=Streptomyces sp. LN549 TaxID=3112979 RepID=UPI003717B7C8